MSEDPLRRVREAVESYPARMTAATAQARDLARQTVTAGSADGTVEIVAAGTGDIVAVRVLSDRRRLDNLTLSAAVVDATNAALDAVDRLRAASLPEPVDVQGSLAEAADAVARRMEDLMSTLDQIGRELDAQVKPADPGAARNPASPRP